MNLVFGAAAPKQSAGKPVFYMTMDGRFLQKRKDIAMSALYAYQEQVSKMEDYCLEHGWVFQIIKDQYPFTVVFYSQRTPLLDGINSDITIKFIFGEETIIKMGSEKQIGIEEAVFRKLNSMAKECSRLFMLFAFDRYNHIFGSEFIPMQKRFPGTCWGSTGTSMSAMTCRSWTTAFISLQQRNKPLGASAPASPVAREAVNSWSTSVGGLARTGVHESGWTAHKGWRDTDVNDGDQDRAGVDPVRC